MLRTRGYKYELRVNNKEKTLLTQCAGTARFAWNWGLTNRLEQYKKGIGKERYTDAMKQHKEINRLKKTTFRWMYNYSKCIPQESLRDLEKSFKKFFHGRKNGQKVGFPKFKKKFRTKDSFRLTGTIRVIYNQRVIQLPRLGKLRLKEYPRLPSSSRILSATVSRKADSWFVALTVEEECFTPFPVTGEIIGLDAGLKQFLTISNGLTVPPAKFLLRRLKKLRKLSQNHSRKKQGSNSRIKSAKNLARFYQRVANCRQDFLHKLSTTLAKNHSVIVVEDLHIKGLSMNKKQAKNWADLSHGSFRNMLKYKTRWYGSSLIEVPRFFPSSKLCSNCLTIKDDLTLHNRIYECNNCGSVLDRDVNAANNMVNYYQWHAPHLKSIKNILPSVTESSPETLTACGEEVSPSITRRSSVNQE